MLGDQSSGIFAAAALTSSSCSALEPGRGHDQRQPCATRADLGDSHCVPAGLEKSIITSAGPSSVPTAARRAARPGEQAGVVTQLADAPRDRSRRRIAIPYRPRPSAIKRCPMRPAAPWMASLIMVADSFHESTSGNMSTPLGQQPARCFADHFVPTSVNTSQPANCKAESP